MKMQLGAALTALLLLAGCAPPKPAPAPTAAAAGDQAQTAQATPPKKMRCSNGTGSRLGGGDCTGQGTTDNQESGSQAYQSGLAGNSMGRPH